VCVFVCVCVQIAPLKVRREWYKLDKEYIDKIAHELGKQLGDSERLRIGAGNEGGRENRPPAADKGPSNLHQHSEAFSEFESRYGLHADPLYSRHQREKFLLGLSPGDVHNVFVEPHILATPTLADTNGDGNFNELVVPVSYYFDPFYYGDPHNLGKLGGLDSGELVHFVAGGVVVIDLSIGAVVGQKVLGLTEATDSQPAYMLSSPTVVRMFPDVGGAVIITATATGEVNMLEAESLESVSGFPVRLDSVSASVAVADLFKDGVLELVVGDNSGNIYCIDSRGKRRWEF
ncbi:Protein DEFECTIVE IN EXINE FORMATION 1, partial [Geodia barretti]